MPGYSWTLTRDDIIKNAFQRCGAIEEKDDLTPEQITMGYTFLQILIKSFSNETIGRLVTFPWFNQIIAASSSVFGDTDSLPYRCIYPHASAALNRPTTGPAWPTVWARDDSVAGSTWLISTGYTTIGAFPINVFAFGTSTGLPTGIIGINSAFLRYQGVDTPLTVISSLQYSKIANKSGPGKPEEIYFDHTTGYGFILPEPDKISPDYVIRIQFIQLLADYSTGAETSQLRDNALRMLTLGLAYDLSFPLGLPLNERMVLVNEYEKERVRFVSGDKEFRGQEQKRPGSMVV